MKILAVLVLVQIALSIHHLGWAAPPAPVPPQQIGKFADTLKEVNSPRSNLIPSTACNPATQVSGVNQGISEKEFKSYFGRDPRVESAYQLASKIQADHIPYLTPLPELEELARQMLSTAQLKMKPDLYSPIHEDILEIIGRHKVSMKVINLLGLQLAAAFEIQSSTKNSWGVPGANKRYGSFDTLFSMNTWKKQSTLEIELKSSDKFRDTFLIGPDLGSPPGFPPPVIIPGFFGVLSLADLNRTFQKRHYLLSIETEMAGTDGQFMSPLTLFLHDFAHFSTKEHDMNWNLTFYYKDVSNELEKLLRKEEEILSQVSPLTITDFNKKSLEEQSKIKLAQLLLFWITHDFPSDEVALSYSATTCIAMFSHSVGNQERVEKILMNPLDVGAFIPEHVRKKGEYAVSQYLEPGIKYLCNYFASVQTH